MTKGRSPTASSSPSRPASQEGSSIMVIGVAHLQPIVAIISGVLILVWPRVLNYVVAIYLILSGILGLGILR
jgi:hypothetical protein